MIIPDLKAYRPRKRPLVIDPVRHVPEKVKKTRRQIVRDWFFFVVWSLRLKKMLKGELSVELLNFEIQRNAYKYRNALQRMTAPQKEKQRNELSDILASSDAPKGHSGNDRTKYIDSFMHEFESVQKKRNKEKLMKKMVRFLEKTYLTLKVGEVKLCVHENAKQIMLNGSQKPSLEAAVNMIALHAGVERGTFKMALHLREIFLCDYVLRVVPVRGRQGGGLDQSMLSGLNQRQGPMSARGFSPANSLRGSSPHDSAVNLSLIHI